MLNSTFCLGQKYIILFSVLLCQNVLMLTLSQAETNISLNVRVSRIPNINDRKLNKQIYGLPVYSVCAIKTKSDYY